MKTSIPALAFSLLISTPVLGAATSGATKATSALQFNFTRDEGCDSQPVRADTYTAAGYCVPFTTHGNLGAQVVNLLNRGVRLQLFSDANCTPSDEVFGNSVLPVNANECYGDIFVANSIIVSLA